MPCAKGMTKCKSGCLHRQMVEDYRAARHANVLEIEALTCDGAGESTLLRENGFRPMTFKRWLQGSLSRRHRQETVAPMPMELVEGW